MSLLPPIPAWNAVHPLIVHLPIGALPVVPPLLIAAMLGGRHARALGVPTLIVLAIATAGAFLATSSGDAARHIAVASPTTDQVLHDHEEFGDMTANLTAVLTGLYALLLGAAALLKDRLPRAGWIACHAALLLLYTIVLYAAINAGHLGARLVHQYGIRAPIIDPAPSPPTP